MIKIIGGLAQLVQSTWFTPRGSLVRIQYSPQKKVDVSRPFFIFQNLSRFRASRFASGGSPDGINYSQQEWSTFGSLFLYFNLMYYCYILYSQKLDKFYIGSTADLEGRLQRHNTSNKGFTSTGKPWELKYYETFDDKSDAMKREMQLKKWKSRNAILKLIEEF